MKSFRHRALVIFPAFFNVLTLFLIKNHWLEAEDKMFKNPCFKFFLQVRISNLKKACRNKVKDWPVTYDTPYSVIRNDFLKKKWKNLCSPGVHLHSLSYIYFIYIYYKIYNIYNLLISLFLMWFLLKFSRIIMGRKLLYFNLFALHSVCMSF